MDAGEHLERRREDAVREWAELRRAVRGQTGLAARSVAWLVGLAGVAIGLEVARRWLPRPTKPQEPPDGMEQS